MRTAIVYALMLTSPWRAAGPNGTASGSPPAPLQPGRRGPGDGRPHFPGIAASDLIALLDSAGIRRALVLCGCLYLGQREPYGR
jgi:hypothetical protein